jgi:hypothetical protein
LFDGCVAELISEIGYDHQAPSTAGIASIGIHQVVRFCESINSSALGEQAEHFLRKYRSQLSVGHLF